MLHRIDSVLHPFPLRQRKPVAPPNRMSAARWVDDVALVGNLGWHKVQVARIQDAAEAQTIGGATSADVIEGLRSCASSSAPGRHVIQPLGPCGKAELQQIDQTSIAHGVAIAIENAPDGGDTARSAAQCFGMEEKALQMAPRIPAAAATTAPVANSTHGLSASRPLEVRRAVEGVTDLKLLADTDESLTCSRVGHQTKSLQLAAFDPQLLSVAATANDQVPAYHVIEKECRDEHDTPKRYKHDTLTKKPQPQQDVTPFMDQYDNAIVFAAASNPTLLQHQHEPVQGRRGTALIARGTKNANVGDDSGEAIYLDDSDSQTSEEKTAPVATTEPPSQPQMPGVADKSLAGKASRSVSFRRSLTEIIRFRRNSIEEAMQFTRQYWTSTKNHYRDVVYEGQREVATVKETRCVPCLEWLRVIFA